MEQHLNNNQNEFLWTLLANPANDAHLYAYNLQRLVNDFPQSGILQALLAHASEDKNLKQASVYFSPRSLFKLINAPDTFTGVPDERIIIQAGLRSNDGYRHVETPVYDEPLIEYQGENIETNTDEFHIDHSAPVVESGPEALINHFDEWPLIEHEAVPLDLHTEGHPVENPEEDVVTENHQVGASETESPEFVHEVDEEKEGHAEEAVPETEIPAHAHEFVHAAAEEKERHAEEAVPETEIPAHAHEFVHEVAGEKERPANEATSETEIPAPAREFVHEAAEEKEGPTEEAGPETKTPAHAHEFVHEAAEEKERPAEEATTETEIPAPAHEFVHGVDEEKEGPLEEPIPETEVSAPVHDVVNEHIREDKAPREEAPHETATPPTHSQVDEVLAAAEVEHPEPGINEVEIERPFSEIREEFDAEKDGPIAIINDDKEDGHQQALAETDIQENIGPADEGTWNGEMDEIFDEIVGIENIHFNQRSTGDNFFSFDQEFGAHVDAGQTETATASASKQEGDPGHQDVSKYHDEKMPYTFMWWLDKTRKEHARIYQPYVKPPTTVSNKKTKKLTDELQQQYFENIFHITSVEELDKVPAPPPSPIPLETKRKEQVIIERFIKEEPQIKPQSSDKLDNENKAKKSSEDRDELVTETLAGIYSDQMLYHKAIASYKKLMLKFPEKYRYFAEKIEQLEKKTN